MSFISTLGVLVPPLTAGGVVYGNGSAGQTSAAGTAGQYLKSNGAGIPGFADLGALANNNTAVGTNVLVFDTTGEENTGVGYLVLIANNTGSYNTGVGSSALLNTLSSYNTAVGNHALLSNISGSNNTAIGAEAGSLITGSNNVVLGGYDGSAAPISGTGSGYIVFSDGAGNVRQTIDSNGDVGIGTTNPQVKLEVSGSNNSTWSATTSTISGVSMTVGVVSGGAIAIGDLVFGANVQPYTRITSGSGSSWTVSVSQTVPSTTIVGGPTYANTLIRITDTDTAQSTNQPTGGLQFFTSDASSPTAGVGAYVAALAESNTPDTSLVFGTRDNGGGGVDANERMRISSAGNVGIGGAANASAILDAQSTTKGVRMPNMTTTEKNAIVSPAAGLMVFDTTLAKLAVYSGAAWQTITSI